MIKKIMLMSFGLVGALQAGDDTKSLESMGPLARWEAAFATAGSEALPSSDQKGEVRATAKRTLSSQARSASQRRRVGSREVAAGAVIERVCQWRGCQERQVFATDQEFYAHSHAHCEGINQCRWAGCYIRLAKSYLSDWLDHMKSHTGERQFVCDVAECGQSFARRSNWKRHKLVHSDERPLKCGEVGCGKGFKHACDLVRHKDSAHK